jgi:hypothetical protein
MSRTEQHLRDLPFYCTNCVRPMSLRGRNYVCERCGYTRGAYIDLPPRTGWFSRCLTRLRNLVGIS